MAAESAVTLAFRLAPTSSSPMPLRLTASELSKELGGIARDVIPRLQHVGLKTFLLVVTLVFRY
ncbi:hypothetical protein [Bradyrhizobium shewense]|uniref:hypothetical protein n=1 Tax=Bradyrhizobium shewense TaxID=1761772 RepID=UPI00101AE75A|nr:hypothetical protein [Bradyrhizobium shewense]